MFVLWQNNKLSFTIDASCLLHFSLFMGIFQIFSTHIGGMEIVEAGIWERERFLEQNREFLFRGVQKTLLSTKLICINLLFISSSLREMIYLPFTFSSASPCLSLSGSRIIILENGILVVVNLKKWEKFSRVSR